MRTYQTTTPRTSECERCDSDISKGATVVVEPVPGQPKRARQTFICTGCSKHLNLA